VWSTIETVEELGNIRKKDIDVISRLEDIKYKLHANELLQVMINLIKNATDAVEQRGVIKIKLYADKNKIIIEVEDDNFIFVCI